MFAPVLIALAHLALHALTNGNYGVFRDELYYLDCARHLAWGYVDHPPLSIWLLAIATGLLGDSIHAIRLLSELAGAGLILMAAVLAREFGGGRFAQAAAALAAAFSPAVLVETGFYSMNAFDLLFWAVLAGIVARLANGGGARGWLWFGLVAGLGLLNKISVLFFGLGIVAALPFTPLRRQFARWELYAGGLIAALLFLPYILWNAGHDWATLQFIDNAQRYKIVPFTPAGFMLAQVMGMSPILSPLWIAGLIWLLASARGKRYCVLGIAYLVVLVLLMAQRAKPYYAFPAYAMLIAAGGCAVESALRRWRSPWPRGALLAAIGLGGAVSLPLEVPILPPEMFLRYQAALNTKQTAEERGAEAAMPQYFADRFGWENVADTVASVYAGLPEHERAHCAILASNYGEAGAINYYGRRLGLPRSLSTHNSHYFWGLAASAPEIIIYVGSSSESLSAYFDDVHVAAVIRSPYAMPYETNLPVYVCRGLKMPWDQIWRAGKKFI